jgi:hypothetical protein
MTSIVITRYECLWQRQGFKGKVNVRLNARRVVPLFGKNALAVGNRRVEVKYPTKQMTVTFVRRQNGSAIGLKKLCSTMEMHLDPVKGRKKLLTAALGNDTR